MLARANPDETGIRPPAGFSETRPSSWHGQGETGLTTKMAWTTLLMAPTSAPASAPASAASALVLNADCWRFSPFAPWGWPRQPGQPKEKPPAQGVSSVDAEASERSGSTDAGGLFKISQGPLKFNGVFVAQGAITTAPGAWPYPVMRGGLPAYAGDYRGGGGKAWLVVMPPISRSRP